MSGKRYATAPGATVSRNDRLGEMGANLSGDIFLYTLLYLRNTISDKDLSFRRVTSAPKDPSIVPVETSVCSVREAELGHARSRPLAAT